MKIKFYYGPVDGAEVLEKNREPDDLPEVLVLPKDDEWGVWNGVPVTYTMSHVRFGPMGREVHYTLATAVNA